MKDLVATSTVLGLEDLLRCMGATKSAINIVMARRLQQLSTTEEYSDPGMTLLVTQC